jgi:hypothetical protein
MRYTNCRMCRHPGSVTNILDTGPVREPVFHPSPRFSTHSFVFPSASRRPTGGFLRHDQDDGRQGDYCRPNCEIPIGSRRSLDLTFSVALLYRPDPQHLILGGAITQINQPQEWVGGIRYAFSPTWD